MQSMLSIKTIKHLAPSKTQKMIKQSLQKQDFFHNVLIEVEQAFKSDEYQFLIDYVIPKKKDAGERRRPHYRKNNYFSLHSKENTSVLNLNRGSIPQRTKQVKSFVNLRSQSSQEGFGSLTRAFTATKVKRGERLEKKNDSNKQKTVTTDTQIRKKIKTIKFNDFSFLDKGSPVLKNQCSIKLTKKSNKALQQTILSQSKVKQSYKEVFLQDIMKAEMNDNDKNRRESADFQEEPNLRKTYQPQSSFSQFWEKQKELQLKYRHFTSVKFSPQKKSKSGLQICYRKF